MIKKYTITLKRSGNIKIRSDMAYPLYSELMKHISSEYAHEIHKTGFTPISQFLDLREDGIVWKISLFGDKAIKEFSNAIDEIKEIKIHNYEIVMSISEIQSEVISCHDIIKKASKMEISPWQTIKFVTPTNFKTMGEYALFPSAELIINSLLKKWNNIASEYQLDDEDMRKILLDGVKISGYNISSTIYNMKGQHIRAFIGSVKLYTKLPAPIMQVYKTLILLSEYSGIGIKTALGMGGIKII